MPKVRGAAELYVVLQENPEAVIFKEWHIGKLSARVCGECGYTEFYVDNPEYLYEVYKKVKDVGR